MATYTDIDLSFGMHPSTKDVLKLVDVSAAKFALKNLLLTSAGEHTEDPFFGVGIKELQFELITPILKAFINKNITQSISTYLPEIVLQDLSVDNNPDTGELVITITYYVSGSLHLQTFNYVLERTR